MDDLGVALCQETSILAGMIWREMTGDPMVGKGGWSEQIAGKLRHCYWAQGGNDITHYPLPITNIDVETDHFNRYQ